MRFFIRTCSVYSQQSLDFEYAAKLRGRVGQKHRVFLRESSFAREGELPLRHELCVNRIWSRRFLLIAPCADGEQRQDRKKFQSTCQHIETENQLHRNAQMGEIACRSVGVQTRSGVVDRSVDDPEGGFHIKSQRDQREI